MPDEVTQLLTEIRDLQRDQLAEYRRLAQQSVELQQRAVARQARISKVYYASLIFGAVMIVGGAIFLFSVLKH
jgi:hypothetical protein